MLSACQQGQDPELEHPVRSWRVIESLGDARIESSHPLYMNGLRPGDKIAGNSRIVTGRSSHLIVSRGDVQFTASGNTSVVLPANLSPAALSQNHGTIRVRLAAAADAVKRIATPHLMASGTTAVLELQVDDQETTVKVTSGSVALSTSNGHHYAQLVAGASARLGVRTNGQLELKPAADMPFQPSAKLVAAPSNDDAAAPKAKVRPKTMVRKAIKPDRRSAEPDTVAILPASRLQAKAPKLSKTSADKMDAMDEPMLLPANSTDPISSDVDATARPTQLQQQFDRLTKGLLINLPTVKTNAYPDL